MFFWIKISFFFCFYKLIAVIGPLKVKIHCADFKFCIPQTRILYEWASSGVVLFLNFPPNFLKSVFLLIPIGNLSHFCKVARL